MKNKAFIFIIIAGIAWGTSSIFVHYLAPWGFSSLQMTFVRAIVSAVILFTYVFLKNREAFKVTKKELILFFASGFSYFATATCYYVSMQMTSVSTAVVLMYTAPVLVMIYSVAFMGEKLTALKTVSVISMLIGCCLVSGIIGGIKFDFIGIVFGVLSGISYSAYNIFTKIQMKNGSNPLSATLYCFVFAALIALFSCNVFEMPSLIIQNPYVTLPLLFGLGIFTCVIPYFLYTLSLKALPVGTAAALGIIEPMAATIFSVVLFSEPLTILSLFGIVLILGAVFLLSRTEE